MPTRKIFVFAFMVLTFTGTVQANPFTRAKDEIRRQLVGHPIRTEIVGAFISAGVSAWGLHECRIPNVENCTGHYGSAWGTYFAAEGLHAVAITVGAKIGGKTGAAIAHGSNFLDAGYGAWEWHGGLNKPSEHEHPDKPKEDFSKAELIHF